MKGNNFKRAVLVAGSVLILIGVALMTWMLTTEEARSDIEIRITEETFEVVEFEGLGLLPGEECEYIVAFKGDRAESYTVTLDFVELDEGDRGTLKNFAYVKIEADGEVICDLLLSEAFEKEDIVLPVDFKEGVNTEFKVVYYLPIDVGNEAKNAEADFELLITASNE